jgi:regulator of sigma E protease
MNEFFGSILWLIIALGLLISFHEFGHFWVARKCGVKVLRFAVGFGRPLWRRTGKDGTEYVIAALPLGGYVKMLDEREGDVDPAEAHMAFNRKPVWSRIAIVAAGPIFNLVLAVAVFWVMYMVGIADMRAVLGETTGLAAQAGLKAENAIVAVDDRDIETWSDAFQALVIPAVEKRDVEITQQHPQTGTSKHILRFSQLPKDFREVELLDASGLSVWRVPISAELSSAEETMPAYAAGLRPGDVITSINDQTVNDWYDITRLIAEHGQDLQPIKVTWQRAGAPMSAEIKPVLDDSGQRPLLGIRPAELPEAVQEQYRSYQVVQHYGPLEAFPKAFTHTTRLISDTLSMLKQLVLGRASLDNLSGPITIARLANDSAALGVARFLAFLGLISLSLGILNLLPVPLLDGGHLMYYFIELLKGSPVSDNFQMAGQYVGVVLLASLMGLAIFNDILRLFA